MYIHSNASKCMKKLQNNSLHKVGTKYGQCIFSKLELSPLFWKLYPLQITPPILTLITPHKQVHEEASKVVWTIHRFNKFQEIAYKLPKVKNLYIELACRL